MARFYAALSWLAEFTPMIVLLALAAGQAPHLVVTF